MSAPDSVKESARRRSRERLEERERAILDAATQLFASAGFHATSTRRIAAAAGVSEGTVFHYFGSKTDLMLAILDRFYGEVLNPRAAAILDAVMGTRERLAGLALHHTRSLAADKALMMRLLQVYAGVDLEFIGRERDSPLRALNREYVGHLDRILREGIERGDLRQELDIHAFRDAFFGGLEYGLRTHLYRHGERGLEEWIQTLLEPLWGGIRAPERAGGTREADIGRLAEISRRLDRAVRALERRGG